MVASARSAATLVLNRVEAKTLPDREMALVGLQDRQYADLQLAASLVAGPSATNASGSRTGAGGSGNNSSPGSKSTSPARSPLKLNMSFTMPLTKSKSAKELALCPSAAATPRRPSFFGNFQVRPAQIWAPSAGTANDFARIRNGGKPLQTRQTLGLTSQDGRDLLRVSSAPVIVCAVSSAAQTPKTPRSTRGMVRKVSKVLCNYPEVNLLTQNKPPSPSPSSPASSSSPDRRPGSAPRSESASPPKSRRATQKRVSFADEVPEELQKITTSFSPEGFQSQPLKRSMRLLDSLYDLRRVQRDEEAAIEAGVPIPREEDQEGALLHSTLSELYDNEAALRSLEAQLCTGQEHVSEHGGSRHATAVLSARTLGVVKRKANLLHAVQARSAAFEAAHNRHEEIVPQLLAGDTEPPPELMGVRKFINQYTHKGGNPVDADRTDFEAFCKSFKLPYRHRELQRMRELSDKISQWWCEAALRVAQEGANYVQIRRMFAVAIGAGADDDHPYLLRATTILNDRLADKVLKDAQDRQRRDTEAAARVEVPQVGPASRAADAIEQAIFQVVAEGVPSSDKRIADARQIMKELREADGQRKRLAGRQKRLAEKSASGS